MKNVNKEKPKEDNIIKLLRTRADTNFKVAYWALGASALLLGISIYFFVVIDRYIDTRSVISSINKIKSYDVAIDSTSNKLASSLVLLKELDSRILAWNSTFDTGNRSGLNKALIDIERQVQVIGKERSQVKEVLKEIEAVKGAIREVDDVALKIQFAASLSARIGIVLILFFFARVLIRMFIYSIRLGNFFAARADALVLLEDKKGDLKLDELVTVLSPDALNIGMTKTPTAELMDLLKSVLELQKSK
jgi:hypothetical protein